MLNFSYKDKRALQSLQPSSLRQPSVSPLSKMSQQSDPASKKRSPQRFSNIENKENQRSDMGSQAYQKLFEPRISSIQGLNERNSWADQDSLVQSTFYRRGESVSLKENAIKEEESLLEGSSYQNQNKLSSKKCSVSSTQSGNSASLDRRLKLPVILSILVIIFLAMSLAFYQALPSQFGGSSNNYSFSENQNDFNLREYELIDQKVQVISSNIINQLKVSKQGSKTSFKQEIKNFYQKEIDTIWPLIAVTVEKNPNILVKFQDSDTIWQYKY